MRSAIRLQHGGGGCARRYFGPVSIAITPKRWRLSRGADVRKTENEYERRTWTWRQQATQRALRRRLTPRSHSHRRRHYVRVTVYQTRRTRARDGSGVTAVLLFVVNRTPRRVDRGPRLRGLVKTVLTRCARIGGGGAQGRPSSSTVFIFSLRTPTFFFVTRTGRRYKLRPK